MQKITGIAILVYITLTLSPSLHEAWSDDWSRFRGPNGSGVTETTGLPVEIGPETNVVWKTPLPPGHSSPILTDDGIFLTAFEGKKLLTIGLDLARGHSRPWPHWACELGLAPAAWGRGLADSLPALCSRGGWELLSLLPAAVAADPCYCCCCWHARQRKRNEVRARPS